jgi:hypothetical protein
MSRFISIGLPESGKTTYLAALWHVLESREVHGALQLSALQADREYLNTIRDAWLSFSSVPRTLVPAGGIVFTLADEADSLLGTVEFPDLPGESFRAQWTERQWSEDYDGLVRSADGVLLFVHPSVIEPRQISEADAALGSKARKRKAAAQELAWNPERSPTQAQAVELLQFLAEAWQQSFPIPAAIIVSAWDRVAVLAEATKSEEPTPANWIAARLPLLSQFLRANPELFRTRIYGVSAQGGDFEVSGDRERMMDHVVTSDRIRVVGPDRVSHDPTSPLRWLMQQGQEP